MGTHQCPVLTPGASMLIVACRTIYTPRMTYLWHKLSPDRLRDRLLNKRLVGAKSWVEPLTTGDLFVESIDTLIRTVEQLLVHPVHGVPPRSDEAAKVGVEVVLCSYSCVTRYRQLRPLLRLQHNTVHLLVLSFAISPAICKP